MLVLDAYFLAYFVNYLDPYFENILAIILRKTKTNPKKNSFYLNPELKEHQNPRQ